jgi:hypothetical protein
VRHVDLELVRRPHGVRRDALPQRLREDERLDRRAGLAGALSRQVERRGAVVVAADHRPHLAGAVLDRHDRRARAVGVRQPLLDGGLGGVLKVAVDRRLDREPALERAARALLAAAQAVDDLLLDPRGEVRVRRVLGRRLQVAALGERLPAREVVLRLREEVLLEHPLEHDVAALQRRLRVGDRVVRAGRGDHAREQRGVLRGEIGGALLVTLDVATRVKRLEVRARRRLDAIGAVPEVDRVQVVVEDLLLGPLVRQVVRERGLAQLLEQRAVVLGGEGVLHQLLGDRRAALHDALLDHVLVKGAADAAQVDALVGVEAPVLDRDDRVLHHGSDLGLLEEQPLLAAGEQPEVVALHVRQVRVARRRELELRQVGRDGHHHPEDGRDPREEAEADQQQEQPQLADPHVPARRLGPLALAVRPQRDHGSPVSVTAIGRAGMGACGAFVIAH